ncbi:hypothetical protein Mmc1_0609 [Magnetococcus marinus MC-1]|uniref:Uncharacterized protein n=2 Tax=Magnetococcus TaxID=162171 RepID=A0L587_MAGMM|nr:hypothetical protein Mmc1_0609 [Magnetococcus marinus MC-1]
MPWQPRGLIQWGTWKGIARGYKGSLNRLWNRRLHWLGSIKMSYPCEACQKQLRLGRYAAPHGALQSQPQATQAFLKAAPVWLCQTCGSVLHAPDRHNDWRWVREGCY